MVLSYQIFQAEKNRHYTLILAKTPRSDAEEVLEWIGYHNHYTVFPSSESLYYIFSSTLGLGSSSQGCKLAEMHFKFYFKLFSKIRV